MISARCKQRRLKQRHEKDGFQAAVDDLTSRSKVALSKVSKIINKSIDSFFEPSDCARRKPNFSVLLASVSSSADSEPKAVLPSKDRSLDGKFMSKKSGRDGENQVKEEKGGAEEERILISEV